VVGGAALEGVVRGEGEFTATGRKKLLVVCVCSSKALVTGSGLDKSAFLLWEKLVIIKLIAAPIA
jgi:hypothetical protein